MMQHAAGRSRVRITGVVRSLALALAGAGCGGDASVESPSPATSAGKPPTVMGPAAMGEPIEPAATPVASTPQAPVMTGGAPAPTVAPEPEPAPAFVEVASCSRELAACERASAVPCTLRCGTRADGCVVYSEFVPLGTVEPGYGFGFGAIDPAGEWVHFRRDWSGGRLDTTPYIWSSAGGAVLLADALGIPPTSEEFESLLVLEVAAGGDAVLLQRFGSEQPLDEHYLWRRSAGLTPLEFSSSDISTDGRVVVGWLEGRAVIWDEAAGLRRLDGGALDEPPAGASEPPLVPPRLLLSGSGEFVFSIAPGGDGYRWSAAQGAVPFDSLPGFPGGTGFSGADPNGRVILAAQGVAGIDAVRLWRWVEGEGAEELGTLPGSLSGASYEASLLRDGGRVVVGSAHGPSGAGSVVFRWTLELGMQPISSSEHSSFPRFASAEGTTIIGSESIDGIESGFRWTAHAGSSAIPGGSSALVALAGDVLVMRSWDGTRAGAGVLKYDRAFAAGGLPIDIIETGLLPEGYELGFVDVVSENARLLAGTAYAQGSTQGWVLRLRDSCEAN